MKFQKTLSLFCVVVLGLAASASAAGEGWMTDFEAAQVKAKAENKPMLLDFTGSDWCGWCIKLDKCSQPGGLGGAGLGAGWILYGGAPYKIAPLGRLAYHFSANRLVQGKWRTPHCLHWTSMSNA